jgi:predicted nucleic acid-binding protein
VIVVSDTGPIHYLTLIGHVDVLPALFQRVIIPRAVAYDELDHPSTPEPLRRLVRNPPPWLSIHDNPAVIPPTLANLGAGEANAISLALELHPTFLLCDDRAARHAAESLGLRVTGTLGIIEEASVSSLLNFDAAIQLLLDRTNFRNDAPLIQRVRQQYLNRIQKKHD